MNAEVQATETQEEPLAGVLLDEQPEEEPEQPTEQPAEEQQEAAEADGANEPAEDESADHSLPPEVQEKVDRIAGKITARYKSRLEEAEARAQEAERRFQEAQERSGYQPDYNPETGEPVIPQEAPDPFSSDYEQQLAYREQQIRKHAIWEAQQQYQQSQVQEAQQARVAEINKQAEVYVQRGADYGLTPQDIQVAGTIVAESGALDDTLIRDTLEDEAGPAITAYLSRHPDHLEKIRELRETGTVLKAAKYIERTVKPNALRSVKKKAEPKPVSTENGSGSREDDMPKGAVFL